MSNPSLRSLIARTIFTLFLVAASACGSTASPDTADTAADAGMEDMTHDDETEHGGHDDDHGGHGAGLEVTAGQPVPNVAIELTETDTAGMFDLAVSLTDFVIDAEAIDAEPVDNTGHMHLLIDGVKIDRFTELNRQVEIPGGEHLIEVELNANDHRAWTVNGEPIRAGETVNSSGTAVVADVVAHFQAVAGIVKRDLDERVDVAVGDIVELHVETDFDDEIHLHGYDITVDVPANKATTLQFTADIPGTFEVELEDSGTFLVELVVS